MSKAVCCLISATVLWAVVQPIEAEVVSDSDLRGRINQRGFVIVPKKDDRVDRPKATTEKTKIDDKVEVLRVAKADATAALGEGVTTWKTSESEWLWIVTAGNDASNLLNNYGKVQEMLQTNSIGGYKIVLLNPNETEINDDALLGIDDPHLVIAETEGNHPANYTGLFEKHKAAHNADIIAWVHARDVYKPELSWDALGNGDLYRLARVAIDALGPKSLLLSEKEISEPKTTKESIVNMLQTVKKNGPPRKIGIDLIYNPWPEGKETVYKGWSIEEVAGYNDWYTRQQLNQRGDVVDYRTWGEILTEIVTSGKEPPESHSNREKWEKLGFKPLNQCDTKIGNGPVGCSIYSIIHALQLNMLEKGNTNSKVDHLVLEKMINSAWPNGYSSKSKGLEKMISNGIPLKDGGRFRPKQITISDIYGHNWESGSLPDWMRDKMHVHTRALTPQYEIATGFRDLLIKNEVSQGRPVVVFGIWPDDKVKRKWGPLKWVTEHSGEAVVRLVSHPSGLAEHASVIVGYKPDPLDPRKTLYECANSWGPTWADKGYVWFSSEWYDFWNNRRATFTFISIDME